jgi:uncharacterized protein YecE (DUF72 family)
MIKGKKYKVGCQSWQYQDWVTPAAAPPVFYPRKTKPEQMLELYANVFDTVEVDSTLYGTPPATTIEKWDASTPAGFTFSLKTPRIITHDLRLRGASSRLMEEFVDRASLLGPKLGIFLIQFPPTFEADGATREALAEFLGDLPARFRYAVEFRSDSWLTRKTVDLLEDHGIALGLVEGKGLDRGASLRAAAQMTTSFAYVRLMGPVDLEKTDRLQREEDELVDLWIAEIGRLTASEVYIYLSNYFEGFSPASVQKIQGRLGLPMSEIRMAEPQGSLF